jgi:hypothetical protein
MLDLSRKYYAVTDETQKNLIAAAGESLIVRGEHGSLGVFIGFTLTSLSSIGVSLIMLRGRIFGKLASFFGILGNSCLFLYVILVTFVPEIKNIAVMVAAPGGLLALAWILLISITLMKLGVSKQ